uniref:Uncharacterized protein n=1 Tax=Nelumbo nucifera TaxID=4432 RepID=A0A822ZAM7_NELNU|nr:TPA_asm: hypothetical protein HUJ06_014823 [Nelumbo nucifera]
MNGRGIQIPPRSTCVCNERRNQKLLLDLDTGQTALEEIRSTSEKKITNELELRKAVFPRPWLHGTKITNLRN